MSPRIRIALFVVIASILCSASLRADKHEDAGENRRVLTVEGEGKVQAVPDIATLSIGVSQEGEDLDPVMARVRHDIGKILEVVKAQGIEEKDVQTEIFNVRPKFEYDKHTNPRRVGFVVTNQVSVKVRDLKKVGKVLTAVTVAGATSVNGPDFEVDNSQIYQRKALTMAFDDARSKATALADAAGVHLGQIVSMTPGAINRPMPLRSFMMRPMGLAAAADTQEPIAAGEQTLSATVTVVYALQ